MIGTDVHLGMLEFSERSVQTTELLVIGAGPYGLCIAAHARDSGLDVAVVGETMADRWPQHEPETRPRVELTEEHRQRRGASSKTSAKATVGATSAKGEATTEGGDHVEEEETTRRSFIVGEWTVRTGGSETSAYWEFRAIKDEIYLRLTNRDMASFLVTEPEALITYGVGYRLKNTW